MPVSVELIGRLLREIVLATGYVLELEYRVADNSLDDVWAILLHGAVFHALFNGKEEAEVTNGEAVRVAFVATVRSLPEGQVADFIRLLKVNTLESMSPFMEEFVQPNMAEVIDSCLMHGEDITGSVDEGGKEERGEKGVERLIITWTLIFKLRLFLSSRDLHRHGLHLIPPKALKKANGGFFMDYHKSDIRSIISRLTVGIFFSAVGRDSVKVSDFLAGLRVKMNKEELSASPELDFTLDCLTLESRVELARHVEAVSFLVTKYSDLFSEADGEKVPRSSLGGHSRALPYVAAEEVDVEALKKLKKLLKSLKKESRSLARSLLHGLLSLSAKPQLATLQPEAGSEARLKNISELAACFPCAPGDAESDAKPPIFDTAGAKLTWDPLTLRRWHLYSTFGSCREDDETPVPEVPSMQQVAKDVLTNGTFFEDKYLSMLRIWELAIRVVYLLWRVIGERGTHKSCRANFSEFAEEPEEEGSRNLTEILMPGSSGLWLKEKEMEDGSICRKALLTLLASAEYEPPSACSLFTVLSGSLALINWPSQSLHAIATCLMDIVGHSSLSDGEKLNSSNHKMLSATQIAALEVLFEARSMGELYLAAAVVLRLGGLKLSQQEGSKSSVHLSPGGGVLLGAGYWILFQAQSRFVQVVAFSKLFDVHLYILGWPPAAKSEHRYQRSPQPLNDFDQLEPSPGVENQR
ncbi:hypothetical protein R1sor_017905 [Riccia sorocarpa]|uniref:Uncharacterized protein n=1 Tax=Riccia sorocarpa TaxID=122646 RepID=A0ABD3I856_9MARC